MKVILKVDVPNVGKKHEIVEVSAGYAKNYLLKNKLAVADTVANQLELDRELKVLAEKEQEAINDALFLKAKLEKKELAFALPVNHNNGSVFGQISNKAILEEINQPEKLIDKHMLAEKYELTIGPSVIKVNLGHNIVAEIKVFVEAKQK